MPWIRTTQWISLWVNFVCVLTAAPLFCLAQGSSSPQQKEVSVAKIVSPEADQPLRYEGDVKGIVPPGYQAFIAVIDSARIWIQPSVVVNRDGTFTGAAYPGEPKMGCGKKYSLLVFAAKDRQRFKEKEVLAAIPDDCRKGDDCIVSDSVRIFRPPDDGCSIP